jgi:hypothetical protein
MHWKKDNKWNWSIIISINLIYCKSLKWKKGIFMNIDLNARVKFSQKLIRSNFKIDIKLIPLIPLMKYGKVLAL